MKLITTALLLFSVTVAAQIDCALKLEKDSIQVFTCRSANLKYKIIKANFELAASLEQLQRMLLDIDHLGDWQYKTASAKLLKTISPQEIIYHTEVSAPVIDNRDFVIQLKIEEKTSSEWIITATSLPKFIPEKENVVRIPMSKAIWKVREKAPLHLSVEYVIEIDFGDAVPIWLVNSLAHKAPYETFKSMKKQIGKYGSGYHKL
ncbi:MAG: START domain-containing protein [Cyclobacteriaceae bacterium]|nr:START domain-containing protein [Cyclobacteriaceae bacterium]